MSIRVDSNPLLAGKVVVSLFSGHGIQAQDIPSTGASGAGYLFNDVAAQGMSPTDEVRGELLTLPAAGDLDVNEDSSFTFSAPDGTYSFTYRGFRNGVSYGDYTVTLEIGSSDTPMSEDVIKSTVTLSSKALGITLGAVESVIKSTISYNGKLLTAVAGTEVPSIVSLNPTTISYSPKELSVVTGINEGINIAINKTSYSLATKQLTLRVGNSLDINESTLTINSREFFIPPTSYPIFDSSRVYFIKKNKQTSFNM